MTAPDLIIGLMSGTSLDGVDAALVDFSGGAPRIVATAYSPFPEELREGILRLHTPGTDEIHPAMTVANQLAQLYAEAVGNLIDRARIPARAVRAVACHGQTIRHRPEHAYSLQLNNPALLAELVGITVVADFRSRDIAAGGQGAPLVPAFHDSLFRDARCHRVILNVGGIANLTDLPPGRATRGFDCGPGNLLLDAWALRHLGRPIDEGGAWAQTGQTLPVLLDRLLAHDYFRLAPPKSCGREQFSLSWLDGCLSGTEAPADVQATLVALTAQAALQAIAGGYGGADELYVCGGGAHNAAILQALTAGLPETRVDTTEVLGLSPDWVEAVAFAWLAHRALAQLPGNLPEVTGASGPRVLGAIYPA